MELVRNLFGNLASGLIRLGVAVGILVAVGYFIVRPALDSSEKIARETNQNIQRGFNGFGESGEPAGLKDINKTLREVNATVKREVRKSFHVAKAHGPGKPSKLIGCIRHADGDVHKIQRCAARF